MLRAYSKFSSRNKSDPPLSLSFTPFTPTSSTSLPAHILPHTDTHAPIVTWCTLRLFEAQGQLKPQFDQSGAWEEPRLLPGNNAQDAAEHPHNSAAPVRDGCTVNFRSTSFVIWSHVWRI